MVQLVLVYQLEEEWKKQNRIQYFPDAKKFYIANASNGEG